MKRILLSLGLSFLVVLSANSQRNYLVQEDFNNSALPTGWTTTPTKGTTGWLFGIDGATGNSGTSVAGDNNIDGTPLAFYDDDVLGPNSEDSIITLTTAAFDNSASQISFLEFDYNFKFVPGIADSFYVDVFDGSMWNRVLSVDIDDCGHYSNAAQCGGGFPHAFIDISAYKNANCQVRFTYFDDNDWGWYAGIDNVEIWSPWGNDLSVSELQEPESGCGLSSEVVTAVIKNLGTNFQTNFDIEYVVNGGIQVVTETVTDTIFYGDSLIYTFNTLANLTSITTYDLDVFIKLANDENTGNDSLLSRISNEFIYQPTYIEDFEGFNIWKTYGDNSTWQRGTPASQRLNAAAGGQNAFVTNLTGVYNNNELSYLETPCFDFSNSTSDPIMNFSLWYYLEGNNFDRLWMEYSLDNGVTWTKLQAHPVFTASNWYNVTTLQNWNGISNGWLTVENRLDGFAGQPQAKLRFVFSSDGSTQLDGVGVDNFSIRDPQPIDLALNRIVYPDATTQPLCGFGNEFIEVEFENKGTQNINTIYFSRRVDGAAVYTDTLNTTLIPGQISTFTFTDQHNFSSLRNYIVQAWGKTPGDGFVPNDSVPTTVIRNSSAAGAFSLPYSQNFDQMIPGGPPNQGWELSQPNNNTSWQSSNGGTGSLNTGPDADATGGNFWFLETSGNTNPNPQLIGPCINATKARRLRLEFAYHMYGATMGTLFVDVYDGVQWQNGVWSISGQQQTSGAAPWKYAQVSLNQFIGRRVKIRFRGNRTTSFTSDMAVDDVLLYEPFDRDIENVDVLAPFAGCEVSTNSVVQIELFNRGELDTKEDSIYVYYQVDNLPPVKDTVDFKIDSATSATFTFTQTADLGIPGRVYNIKTWTDQIGDENDFNDTIFTYKVENFQRTPNYFEDFETFRDALCDQPLGQVVEEGWAAPQNEFSWNIQRSTCGKGAAVTPSPATGPAGDRTTGRGIFLYTEQIDLDGVGGINNNTATLESPCFDLTGTNEARLSFWYHKYGNQMGDLFIDVLDNGMWMNVDVIPNQTHNSATAPWLVRHVNLDNYTGGLVQVRFRAQRGGDRSDMAIDDVYLYKPSTADVGINVVSSPNGDGCSLGQAPVTVEVENFGLQPIPANSVEVSYNLNFGQFILDTIPNPIPIGGTATFTFPGNIDMSTPGTKRIEVRTNLVGDTLKLNDRYVQNVYNQRMGLPWTTEDFERPTIDGWGRIPTNPNTYSWQKVCGPSSCIDGCVPMPPIAPNGPSGDHTFATARRNGDGCYMVMSSNFKTGVYNDATLLFPCGAVDFSNSKNGKMLLSFWYHRFGAMNTQFGSMGDLFVDVFDGVQWVNGVAVIRGVQQGDDADPWQKFQISLDQFAGVSNGNIRFRAKYLGGPGNMAIDDIELLDRSDDDVAVTEFRRPFNDCGLSNTERVRVLVQNTGLNDIIRLKMCYQITFTPFDGNPVVLDTVCDELVGILISALNRGATYLYEFPTRADMTQPGQYDFKVWSNQLVDDYRFNDTITATVVNETRPFPWCEDFSSWTYGWDAKNFDGGLYPSFWTATTNAYTWKPGLEMNPTPTDGHTRGPNDIYIVANDADGMPGAITQIESPCYDLTNTPTANLEFWFKAPMDGNFMFIDMKRGDAPWQEAVDTIYGDAVFNWTKYSFVLADFVGDFVKFRFRCINAGGYYAIDDLCVIPPPKQQIELERIVTPPMNFCQYLADEIVTFRIQNTGFEEIDSFRAVLAVDTTFLSPVPGNYFRDTMWFYKGIDYNFFQPGDKIDLTLDSMPINMVRQIRYYFFGHLFLPGDPDTTDNLVREYEIVHPVPLQLPYITDFERFDDPYNGWLTGQNGMYTETIKRGVDVAFYTGPADDHTLQNGTGNYWVTQAAPGRPGEAVVLQSQCLDLSQTTSPELSYWYHRHGIHMGDFFVQVNDDFGWRNVDSLKGDQHPRGTAPWNNRIVDLGNYAGDFIRVRFLSFMGNGTASDHAMDDIAIYDLPPLDLAPDSLCSPNEDSSSCYLVNQQVELRIRNNGADSVDFTQDTTFVTVFIDREGLPWDTLYRTISTNEWVDTDDGVNRPLPKDSSVCILMDGTFDMYHIDETFSFHAKLETAADIINVNDSDSYDVFTRELGGNIVRILPDDEVCSGEAVSLELRNYFGRLSWQERTVNAYDPGFWIPGFSPNDNKIYISNPDTVTYYRVWVCNHVYSDTAVVNAIRPYAIDTVRVSKCAGDVNDFTFTINVPDNIDKVFLYKDDVRRYLNREGIFDRPQQDVVRSAFARAILDPIPDPNFVNDAILNTNGTASGTMESGYIPDANGNIQVTYVHRLAYEAYTRPGIIRADTAFNDTLWLETYQDGAVDGCFSLRNTPVIISVVPSPGLGNMQFDGAVEDPSRKPIFNALCSNDSAEIDVLNAGARVGFQYEYNWEIIKYENPGVTEDPSQPSGFILDFNNLGTPVDTTYDTLQTYTVDPWELEKEYLYSYRVTVKTANGCGIKDDPNAPGTKITESAVMYRYIDNKCFVGLEERDFGDMVSIYPNPTSDFLFIRYRVKNDLKGDISLRDINGRLIFDEKDVNLNGSTKKINMHNLPKGVYFIQIDSQEGRLVKKIVKS